MQDVKKPLLFTRFKLLRWELPTKAEIMYHKCNFTIYRSIIILYRILKWHLVGVYP